jgi:hypothetical protein
MHDAFVTEDGAYYCGGNITSFGSRRHHHIYQFFDDNDDGVE